MIEAEFPAYGGSSLGRWNERVVMIKGALPGETVEAEIEEEKRDYYTASVKKILSPSPDRAEPECAYCNRCGGCTLQYASHKGQIALKEDILRDCLKRLARIEIDLSDPLIHHNPWNYRYRGQFKTGHGKIGFYREKTREIIDVEHCPLMSDDVNRFYQIVRGLLMRESGLFHAINEIHISYGDSAVALIKSASGGRNKAGHDHLLARMLLEAGFSGAFIEDKNRRVSKFGKHYTTLGLEGIKYTVSPVSFFQSHWKLNQTVAKFIKDSLQPLEGKRVLDLYSGAGNFSLPVALHAAEVVAVEENPYAVEDGKRNLQFNSITNCRFIRSSAENINIQDDIHILILDPPRLGLSNKTMERALAMSPERIAYISCNPSTLARDLKKLTIRYEIESVRMIDFFPQTYHIESLVFLRPK